MKCFMLILMFCFILLFMESICIRGGSIVEHGSIPYQAAIFDSHNFICSGSLISEQWVLTAASCVGSRSIIVGLGLSNIINQTEHQQMAIPDENIIIHPKFNRDIHDSNIALIKLPTKVIFNENIQPIALVNDTGSYAGTYAIVSGWGGTKKASTLSENLLQASLQVIPNHYCQTIFSQNFNILSSHICTNAYPRTMDYKGACLYDIGAPLVLKSRKPVQIGIVTKPLPQCIGSLPTVFIRVSKFTKWIQSEMNQH